ncbi:MAG: PEP-CTERM sorting domain-containing protein [Planktothrix sp.]
MGTQAAVPEPATVLGLGLVGAALAMSRRKKAQ